MGRPDGGEETGTGTDGGEQPIIATGTESRSRRSDMDTDSSPGLEKASSQKNTENDIENATYTLFCFYSTQNI